MTKGKRRPPRVPFKKWRKNIPLYWTTLREIPKNLMLKIWFSCHSNTPVRSHFLQNGISYSTTASFLTLYTVYPSFSNARWRILSGVLRKSASCIPPSTSTISLSLIKKSGVYSRQADRLIKGFARNAIPLFFNSEARSLSNLVLGPNWMSLCWLFCAWFK